MLGIYPGTNDCWAVRGINVGKLPEVDTKVTKYSEA